MVPAATWYRIHTRRPWYKRWQRKMYSEVILRLLYLSLDNFQGRFGLLDLSLAEPPVEDRDTECYSYDLLIKQILICLRKVRTCLGHAETGVQGKGEAS